jgi:hypothetical protein
MIGDALRRALSAQIFARHGRGEHLYAILDGARDPSLHVAARATGMPARCLFAGASTPPLAEVAPYLVQLHPVHPFAEELLTHGWGKSWGVYAASAASIDEVERHLCRSLRVRRGDGRKAVFRFYDPRVLRAHLPACNADALDRLFGPISAFFVEAERPTTLLCFQRAAGSFAMAKIPVGPRETEAASAVAPAPGGE